MSNKDTVPAGIPSNDDFIKKHEPLMEAWNSFHYLDDPRWGPTASLKNDHNRAVMAVMLENARKQILKNSDDLTVPDTAGTVAKYKANIKKAMAIAENAARSQQADSPIVEASTPVQTTAMSGATNLPFVLGYTRKIMPKMRILDFVAVQPMSLPDGRVFYLDRIRHNNGTNDSSIENRAGWSYRSFDATPGEATAITKTTSFTLASENVSVTNHKMKTEIGIEIEQDLRAFHGIDGAALIDEAATDEMALELQEIILHELWARAGAGTFVIGTKPAGYTVEEWDRRYMEVIQRANETIWTHQRVDARHLILGSEWSVQFSNVGAVNYAVAPVGGFSAGTAGADNDLRTLGDYLVLRAALPFPTGQGLLLHKGATWVDASYFYLPYIPFQPYAVWNDPDKQVRVISWLSRYAKLMVGTNFRGDRRVGLLKIDAANITGTSYPAYTESIGGN